MHPITWVFSIFAAWATLDLGGSHLVQAFRQNVQGVLDGSNNDASVYADNWTIATDKVWAFEQDEASENSLTSAHQWEAMAVNGTNLQPKQKDSDTRVTLSIKESKEGRIVGDDKQRFTIGKKIGKGSFGSVYLGRAASGEVAIKCEARRARNTLEKEAIVMRRVAGFGFPKLYLFGRTERHRVLVMERLGKSVDKLLADWGGRMPEWCALHLGKQMIQRVATMHSKGLIHRDVKPDNFMVGLGSAANRLYAIDFGLSGTGPKAGVDAKPQNFIGTVRYGSITSMQKIQKSWRDDVEEICYVLIYLVRGRLPWQGLSGQVRGKTQKEKMRHLHQLVLAKKEGDEGSTESLSESLHPVFARMLTHARGLDFHDKPNYDMLDTGIQEALVELGHGEVPASFEPDTHP